jgi:hypothetical protein
LLIILVRTSFKISAGCVKPFSIALSIEVMFSILIIAPGTPCQVLSALTKAIFPFVNLPAQ